MSNGSMEAVASDGLALPQGLERLNAASPAAGPWGPSPAAWYAGRLWLASQDRIFHAGPNDPEWLTAHLEPPRKLQPPVADVAQKLGFVEDGPAAAMLGTEVPSSFGIGPLQVLQAPGDHAPWLYAVTRSFWGGRILRSDGVSRFERVPGPSELDSNARVALAGLAVAGDWLVTAPAPVEARIKRKLVRLPIKDLTIYAAPEAGGEWQPASAPGFDADVSGGVTAMTTFQGRIYVAVEDVYRGFELWCAEPTATLPWTWTRVIGRGGHRFSLAPKITAMAVLGEALYLAVAVSETGFGQDRAGPAAAEILRVDADGQWDVLVGTPRFSPDGFKVPLSGLPAGFGDPFVTSVPAMTEAGGILYVGTRDTRAEYRQAARKDAGPAPADHGARIFATADGYDWQSVDAAGHDDPSICAVRALFPGPNGLAAAVAVNHAVGGLGDGLRDHEDVAVWL